MGRIMPIVVTLELDVDIDEWNGDTAPKTIREIRSEIKKAVLRTVRHQVDGVCNASVRH